MKFNFLILFLSFSLVINAQQILSGTITNTKNEPLFGVDVYVEDLQKGTSTNAIGYYQLTNLPSIPFKITIAFIGYESQTKIINLNESSTILDFQLKEAIFKMEEIIISTPFNKLQSENVIKVERATIQQLKNKGAVTLIEGLSSIAGVSQVSTGIGIGKPVIRGLRGNRVLVYTQGIRLENQQFGDEHGLGVDESSIESVEVIKGPASLLYGSDALGGILYFNPLKFAETNTIDFNFNQKYFSNTQGYKTSFGMKKSFNSWKILLNGSHNAHSDYKIPTKTRVSNTRFNETIFNAGLGFDNNLLSSALRFNLNTTKVGVPEEMAIQNNNKEPFLPYQDLKNKMVSLHTLFFLTNSKISTTFGYTSNERKEFEEHQHEMEEVIDHGNPSHPSLDLTLNTFSYDIKWHLPKLKKVETIIGIQGMHQTNENFGEEILIPNAKTNDFGMFLIGSHDWDKNTVQGGFRYDTRNIASEKHIITHDDEEHIFDALNKSYENITASIGYKTTFFKIITGRFNVASGFKAPNLAELTSNGVHHGSNRFEIGNKELKIEQNFQTDLSLEFNTEHFEVYTNGFINYINDYIFISPTGELEEDNFIFKYIQDDAKLYGGEFGMHLHPHPFDWFHINSNFEFVIGKQNNGNYLPLIPANKLTNTFRVEYNNMKWLKNGFTSFTLENFFHQNKFSAFESPSNNYNLINLNLGGNITFSGIQIDVNLNVNNLFNTEYISHLSRLKADGIPNIGRTFIASLSFRL